MNHEPKKGGVPNRGSLYSAIGKERKKILQTLFDLLDSPNENVRLGAAKALLNKILPDLKAMEVTSDQERPLGVVVLPTKYSSKSGCLVDGM